MCSIYGNRVGALASMQTHIRSLAHINMCSHAHLLPPMRYYPFWYFSVLLHTWGTWGTYRPGARQEWRVPLHGM